MGIRSDRNFAKAQENPAEQTEPRSISPAAWAGHEPGLRHQLRVETHFHAPEHSSGSGRFTDSGVTSSAMLVTPGTRRGSTPPNTPRSPARVRIVPPGRYFPRDERDWNSALGGTAVGPRYTVRRQSVAQPLFDLQKKEHSMLAKSVKRLFSFDCFFTELHTPGLMMRMVV